MIVKNRDVVDEGWLKLIENTIKDILLGNTALTLLFALPIAYIVKYGLNSILFVLNGFLAPMLLVVGVWIVSRVQNHASVFFHSKWISSLYVMYVLLSVELVLVYSILQIAKTLISK